MAAQLRLDPTRYVRSGVLSEVVLPVESLSALVANVSLLSRVDHKVQRQLLLPLERLHADRADERTVGVVTLLVPRQVVLALQGCVTNVADKPPLQVVSHQMLFQESPFRIRHLTLGATEQRTSVQGCR